MKRPVNRTINKPLAPISKDSRNFSSLPDLVKDVTNRKTSLPSSPPSPAISSKPVSTEDDFFKQILTEANEAKSENIFTLELRAKKLQSIPKLNMFRRLRVLDASSNTITVINNLSGNTELRELKLYDNCIEIIDGLNNLKELCSLQLQHNKITRIGKGLETNKKLTMLRLDGNHLKAIDTREIAGCGQLTSLDVSFNQITCIKFVLCLSSLEELYACKNRIKSLPTLSRCNRLVELDLSNNEISDVTGLKGLRNLQQLDLSNNRISKLVDCGVLPNLTTLNVQNNFLTEVNCFPQHFPNLEVINIAENKLENIDSFLSSMSQMAELDDLCIHDNPMLIPDKGGSLVTIILETIPNLHYLDGIAVQKSVKGGQVVPLMRPMTASQAISSRTVENQLSTLRLCLNPFEAQFNQAYNNIMESLSRLPEEIPQNVKQISSSEEKQKELSFLSNESSNDYEDKEDNHRLSLEKPPVTVLPSKYPPHVSLASSRSRRKLEEARTFAESLLWEN